jgi:hypothetical protein
MIGSQVFAYGMPVAGATDNCQAPHRLDGGTDATRLKIFFCVNIIKQKG